MTTQELFNNILGAVAGDPAREHDPQYRAWIRRIDAISLCESSGYAFIGKSFTLGATGEVTDWRPGVYLVETVNAPRYPITHYTLVRVGEGLEPEVLPFYATDEDVACWAKIRDAAVSLGIPTISGEQKKAKTKPPIDLFTKIMEAIEAAAPERRHDPRFRAWAKWIGQVDTSLVNDYMYQGEFINPGTTVDWRAGIYLASTINGSRKNPCTHYSVVRVGADGAVEVLPPHTTGDQRGWALRLRDDVIALLGQPASTLIDTGLASYPDADLIKELERRGYDVLSRKPA